MQSERPYRPNDVVAGQGLSVRKTRAFARRLGFSKFSAAAGLGRAGHAAFRLDILRMPEDEVAELGGWVGSPHAMRRFIARVIADLPGAPRETSAFGHIRREFARLTARPVE